MYTEYWVMSTRGNDQNPLGASSRSEKGSDTRELGSVRAGTQISVWLLVQNPSGATSAVMQTLFQGYQFHRELRISGAGHGLPAMVQKVTNPLEE